VREVPHFCQLSEDLPKEEVVILGVSQEEPTVLHTFAKHRQVNYTIGTAAELPAPYCDITGLPTTFVLDRSGVIEQVLVGYHSYDELLAAAPGKRPS
jgi:peroxiredoxin